MWQRRARIVQKPPSFLEAFLYSAGIGVERGVDRYYKERDRKRGITNQILNKVLSGDVSPELLATPLGRSATEQMGIGREPAIQEMQKTGEERWREDQPEIGPPAPLTMQHLRSREEQRKEAREQTKIQAELYVYEEKEKIKRRVEGASRMPLSKRLEIATGEYEKALKGEIPIADVKITDPTTGITMNLETHIEQLEKQQVGQASKTKAGIAYLKAWKEYVSIQQVTTKAIHNLAVGKDVRDDLTGLRLQILNDFLPKKLTGKDAKLQLRNLLPLFNKKLKIQHMILKKQKTLARDEDLALPSLKAYSLFDVKNPDVLAGEIKRLATLGNTLIGSLEPVKEPREALNPKDARHAVNPPPPPTDETVDPSEVTEEERASGRVIINSAGEEMVVRNSKWVKVKKSY